MARYVENQPPYVLRDFEMCASTTARAELPYTGSFVQKDGTLIQHHRVQEDEQMSRACAVRREI